jgi:hypothetical protein
MCRSGSPRDIAKLGETKMRLLPTAAKMPVRRCNLATTVSLSYAQTCQSGCRFDEESAVPLSRATRKRIAQIVRAEQRLGCSE